jgi:hypothetical protein
MASMNEQELRRAILRILWCLLLINSVNRKVICLYSHQEESGKQEEKATKIFRSWNASYLLRSQTISLLPRQQDASIVSFFGLHPTWNTSSLITQKKILIYMNNTIYLYSTRSMFIFFKLKSGSKAEDILMTVKGVQWSVNLPKIP